MTFEPTRDSLLPDLTPQQEITILARTLWREGYDDHLAGHITVRRPDGNLWCNPWLLTWEEFRPEDVIVTGFDDVEFSRFTSPSLTTVGFDRRAFADAISAG